ncbi:TrkH family potassium uptake protein [Natronoflexus pectinivorans]|uniref:Potassium uptake TrkH family protein n=1 Tax=Natronoflexus pectinivorans TaxID=682526 RepID=A0A4R2GE94_9BACT|nr:potassium transporter TrkG [Natronoflexus pectinivorans]TCO06062.1 potassium uptake TrkH family protein [Natronoflexus pectinivorans]
MNFMRFRENVTIFIYDNRAIASLVINRLVLLFYLFGAAVLIYYHGYSHSLEKNIMLMWIFRRNLDFFIISFISKLFFSISYKKTVRKKINQFLIVSYLSLELIYYWISGSNLLLDLFSFLDIKDYFSLLQFFFIILFFSTLKETSVRLRAIPLNPAALLAFSFLTLIIIGTILLHLPEMTTTGTISWIDALFTSTSAACVTGLTVVDTGTYFSFKGQVVILCLIFAGGLNMLTIATFIGSLYHKAGSLHAAGVIKGFLDTDQTANLQAILRNVVIYACIIQFAGIWLVYFSWGQEVQFANFTEKFYFSLFHAMSAFNNAGFSLYADNLYHEGIRHQYFMHMAVALLIVIGGLGFLVLQDMFAKKNREDRKRHPWKKLLVNTRLVLYVTAALIITGTVLFFLLEHNNALKDYPLHGKLVASLFQSVTTRTAGFNTVDTSILSSPSIFLFMLLMFIGASPGSTGGGVKTTTFAVALKAAWANLRGKEHVEFFNRNISWVYVNKTYAVLFSAVSLIVLFTFLLLIAEPDFNFKVIFFELISAFGTVGLSLGITPELGSTGKTILVFAMFVGRIGSLTLGLALTRRVIYTKYRYPNARLMIG